MTLEDYLGGFLTFGTFGTFATFGRASELVGFFRISMVFHGFFGFPSIIRDFWKFPVFGISFVIFGMYFGL